MKTIHRKTRKGQKRERTIGIPQRLFAAILLTILAISHTAAPTAHAGLLDWLGGNAEQVQTVPADRDINRMFLSGTEFTPTEAVPSAIAGHALLASAVTDHTPQAPTVRRRMTLEVSAYNSEAAQTDDSPFIMANGGHVHDGAVATNILPFGTRVKIPKYFGDKVFVVEDRMNKRYQNHLDIWMEKKADALRFGRRTVVVEVIW